MSPTQKDQTPEGRVLTLLKSHAIDILVRMNPSRKNYYKLVWADYNFENLLEYKLSNVFKDNDHKSKDTLGVGLTVSKYFENLFFLLNKKLQETYLFPEQKEKLVIDELVNHNLLEIDDPPIKVSLGTQTIPTEIPQHLQSPITKIDEESSGDSDDIDKAKFLVGSKLTQSPLKKTSN